MLPVAADAGRRTIAALCRASKAVATALFAVSVAFAATALPATAEAPSEAEIRAARAVFSAADQGAWDVVEAMSNEMGSTLVARLARWSVVTRSDDDSTFQELAAFIAENPDWPGVTTLRRRAEAMMPAGLPSEAVVTWFDTFPPLTIDGVIRYGDALERADPIAVQRWARDTWRTLPLTIEEEARFLGRFGRILTEDDHWARLEASLWEDRVDEARRLVPLVSPARRAVADARIKLITRAEDVNAAVAAVPEDMLGNEGLIFDRARWRRRAGDERGALDMLSRAPADTAYAQSWWRERQYLMRQSFEAGEIEMAYALASGGTPPDSLGMAETQFFAGWLALRRLGRPLDAARHFETLYAGVGAPVSLARGAYWAGRAYDAAGDEAAAVAWYERAAEWPVTFYGQLAAARLGRPALAVPPASAMPDPAARTAFEAQALTRATRLLEAVGQPSRAEMFLRQLLAEAETADEFLLIAGLAHGMGRTFIGVRAAKAALLRGALAFEAAFPLAALPEDLRGVDPALVLAVMRQETEFNDAAISSAGAVGLMQVLPSTAAEVAEAHNLPFDRGRLLRDPLYNAQIGALYLDVLISRYRGDIVRAVAAYNAGFNRVDQWGVPGDTIEERVDWIESLPYAETRNYVQRVLENLQVYRLRLADGAPERSIAEDLAG